MMMVMVVMGIHSNTGSLLEAVLRSHFSQCVEGVGGYPLALKLFLLLLLLLFSFDLPRDLSRA